MHIRKHMVDDWTTPLGVFWDDGGGRHNVTDKEVRAALKWAAKVLDTQRHEEYQSNEWIPIRCEEEVQMLYV